MEAYFDNSATTKVTENVKNIVVDAMTKDYGNPSSMHMIGVEAEKYIKDAKDCIADILKVDSKEIYFTSGGTESNNMAIIGSVEANKKKKWKQGNYYKGRTFFRGKSNEVFRKNGI